MAKLILCRGLPASGKSTWAEKQLSLYPIDTIRVERDLLRDQLLGHRDYSRITSEQENLITQIQMAMAATGLQADKTVIISDTNLRAQYVRQWAKFAASHGAGFHIITFDGLSLDELIKRDTQRQHSVGEKVLRDMWNRFTKKGRILDVDVTKELNNTFVIEPYDNPSDLPEAVIVDIDGTIAKMNGRSPYEWHRVGEDSPVNAVIDAVDSAQASGKDIIFMSGRDASCRDITIDWLLTNLPKINGVLFMRAEGDNRKDDIVKYELFNNNVRGKYHVKYVLDDRRQVVVMWRALGLACFQVADGDF